MTTRPAAIARVLGVATATLALVTAGLGLSACSASDPPTRPVMSSGLPGATVPPTPALAPYYEQHLSWTSCGGLECADLRVPLDHAAPDPTKDLTIKVVRVKAADQDNRLGSLLVNPGGPGASGIDYVRAGAQSIGGPDVRRYYDLIGFDPRGVASSDPIDCLDDTALDRFLGTDPTPDDAAEEQALLTEAKAMADGLRRGRPRPRQAPVDCRRGPRHGHPPRGGGRPAAQLPRQVVRHVPRLDVCRPLPPAGGPRRPRRRRAARRDERRARRGPGPRFRDRDEGLPRGLRHRRTVRSGTRRRRHGRVSTTCSRRSTPTRCRPATLPFRA